MSAMRLVARACVIIGLLAVSACGNGSASGGGTGTAAHGRAGISLPF